LISKSLDKTRAAAVLWATLNGSFVLATDPDFFGELTGIDAAGFCRQAIDFQLAGNATSNGHQTGGSRTALTRKDNTAKTKDANGASRIGARQRKDREIATSTPA